MSKVIANTVEPSELAVDNNLTIGSSGGTVTIAGNDIRANTIKDKSGATLWTSDGSGNLSNLAGGFGGNMTLVETSTISSSVAAVEFTGIDNSAKLWIVRWAEIDTDTTGSHFEYNFSDDASSHSYDLNKTTTHVHLYVKLDGGSHTFNYGGLHDLDQSTSGYARGNPYLHSISEACGYGELYIFAPNVHATRGGQVFYSMGATYQDGTPTDYVENDMVGGVLVGANNGITAVRFRISSGNLTGGVIRLFKLTNT